MVPRQRMPRPQSSRFMEGSMNDRASAAPPVAFIGPEDFAALEARTPTPIRPASYPQHIQQPVQPQKSYPVISKRGSKQLLGQVWDGVRGKFKFGREDDRKKKTPPVEERKFEEIIEKRDGERPTRDEIYANYHHLVASGFFSSNAIQSTRQPPPGGHKAPPPTWPLSPLPAEIPAPISPTKTPLSPLLATPSRTAPSSPICSPTSASSRGTKRAADETDDLQGLHKKIRKSASAARELALPRTRFGSISRSFSNRSVGGDGEHREPNRLTKRFTRSSNMASTTTLNTNALQVPQVPDRGSSLETTRVLRPRRSTCVVKPDANRGIPSVPDIPKKFTYGEDRENEGPWRGLRRVHASP